MVCGVYSAGTTGLSTVIINLILASAFASIMICAMELVPQRIGLIGGLFYGLNFGLGVSQPHFSAALSIAWGLRAYTKSAHSCRWSVYSRSSCQRLMIMPVGRPRRFPKQDTTARSVFDPRSWDVLERRTVTLNREGFR
jgi:hypothetical protein